MDALTEPFQTSVNHLSAEQSHTDSHRARSLLLLLLTLHQNIHFSAEHL